MKRMSLRQFGRIVRRVMKTLPPELHRYLGNVVVDVEREPDLKMLRSVYTEEEIADGACMYGLFDPLPLPGSEGIDFDQRPHRLIIYKRPLEEDFPDDRELMIEIRKTVIHELAHHFGYTDDDLEKFDNTPDPFAEQLVEKETALHLARMKLVSLWLSQTARAVADNCLFMFAVLLVAGQGGQASQAAWYQVRAFFILPFLLFAPINGAMANSLGKHSVLVASSGFSLVMVLLVGLVLPATPAAGWWWCLAVGVNMLGAAVYSPTRYALLPAIAQDARVPLPRINGWIEMGSAGGIVLGMLLGVGLAGETWTGLPVVLIVVALLHGVALLGAMPAQFPSDVVRPEPPGRAVVDFFTDCKRIWSNPESRWSMLALAGLMALVLAGTGGILAYKDALAADADRGLLQECMALVAVGVAIGSLLAGLQGHPDRTLGLVPWGVAGLLASMLWVLADSDPRWPILLLGLMGGLANVPLRAFYQASVPADARGNAMAVSNTAERLCQITLAAFLFALVLGGLPPAGQIVLLTGLAGSAALASWWLLYRQGLEVIFEALLWPLYRFHVYGPGVGKIPPRGPVLIIANHTAWFDPLWLGKVIPRRIVPLMTSDFYDLPVIHWLVKYITRAIRVQASTFRREAPELQEAIAALDRGECVTIFPEGRLRRVAEPTVRPFGQGVWHILKARPNTPVVVCWIEGGWGSYTSYDRGRPMQNKWPDFWRHIGIGISEPEVLDPQILADHRATRRYLRQACLEARGHLGLEVPELQEVKDEEEQSEATSGEPRKERRDEPPDEPPA
jgi:1-acyl-sn-glycerol-3-phosphate acyltransferase